MQTTVRLTASLHRDDAYPECPWVWAVDAWPANHRAGDDPEYVDYGNVATRDDALAAIAATLAAYPNP